MKRLLLIILFLTLLVPSTVKATDYWDLVDTAIVAGGYSDVMYGDKQCASYFITIKTSGTVSIVATTRVGNTDVATAALPVTNTYTYTTAAWQTPLTVSGPIPKMVIYFAISTGAIDDVRVECYRPK